MSPIALADKHRILVFAIESGSMGYRWIDSMGARMVGKFAVAAGGSDTLEQ